MGKYTGTVEVPANVVIVREAGCQFQSTELGRRGIRCGQVAGLNDAEAAGCRACINFYYIHTTDIKVRDRSEYSHFETY